MGQFQEELKKAKETLEELHNNRDKISENDFIKKQEEVFTELHTFVQKHIDGELEDEKDIGNLISALMNYRKHLVFANIIIESTLHSIEESKKEDFSLIKKKDPYQSTKNIITQLTMAEKELFFVKQNMERILEAEKIKI
jgi:hypothetical protein